MKIAGKEIFAIPIGDYFSKDNDEIFLLYSPLCDAITVVDGPGLKQVINYTGSAEAIIGEEMRELTKGLLNYDAPSHDDLFFQSPDQYATLSIIPNYRCNFNCSYCYSAKGRSQKKISRQQIKAALDHFINDKRIKVRELRIFISGGGEPFLTWDEVRQAIIYAYERAELKGFLLKTSIITNGSLLNEDIMGILKKYNCSVCVSFEVLKEIQNKQREHYDKVRKNLITLGQNNITTLINSTITPESVNKLEQIVEEVLCHYPFVRQLTLEPVTDAKLFRNKEDLGSFYKAFRANFISARKIAENIGTTVWFSMDNMAEGIIARHCPGKFCLTASGTFTICHCASSPEEERYEKCVYGHVNEDNSISFDLSKFRGLIADNMLSRSKCDDCFARWNCGGECMTRNDQYPQEFMDVVCDFNRDFLKMKLIEKVEEQYRLAFGSSLFDEVNGKNQ